MVSPVPKHLRTEDEHAGIPRRLRDHVDDLRIDRTNGVDVPGAGSHRAKYAAGLATKLIEMSETFSVGDPMCGTGMLAWETGRKVALNDIDPGMGKFLKPLTKWGCEASYVPATEIKWRRDMCIFSPPLLPAHGPLPAKRPRRPKARPRGWLPR